jgi:ubiquinol-cytochrome c reductase cytochrome c1 subunit
MRAPRFLLAALPLVAVPAAAFLGISLLATPVTAQDENPPLIAQNWSFDGIFGTPDLASAQRGFQVYSEVCSACHSMTQLHYRDLTGIGLSMDQIKAIASNITVPDGLDDQGQPKEGPATPASQFRSPFPNEIAAKAANNGAAPPDLSLIVNAREGGADYVYGILTGFAKAPPGFKVPDGLYYNRAFPGHLIHMPPPLSDGRVDYTDGTPNNLDQEARDVVTFLEWASNPEMAERKEMGVRVILFLVLLTGVTYAVKRKVWSDVH